MKIPRMAGWIALTVMLLFGIWYFAPQQLQVVMYKTCLVTFAAVIAYFVDRSLYARLSDRLQGGIPRDVLSASRIVARSLVFLGVVLGMTLGV